MSRMPNIPDVACQCGGHPLASGGCICPADERALRAWRNGALPQPMTPEQRAWCLEEIGSVEGCRPQDYAHADDATVASGVLGAWIDYCRDKGLV